MKKYKKIYVEITNNCNLSCSFCPKTTREKQFITTENFEHIIKNTAHLSDYYYLHLMGEPLLHPKLNEFLKICEKYNKKVVITTNGTLIKECKDIILNSKSVYKVVFSVHSFEANDYSLSMTDYLSEIINCCKEFSQKEIICVMRFWNLDKDNLKGQNSLNNQMFDFIQKSFPNIDFDNIDSSSRDIKLAKKIYVQTSKRFDWPDKNKETISKNCFCYGLRDHFGILVDGTVVPCCLDNNGEINLGNCLNQDIDVILNSDRAKNIYNGFSQRKAIEELCQKCEFVTKFNN